MALTRPDIDQEVRVVGGDQLDERGKPILLLDQLPVGLEKNWRFQKAAAFDPR